MLLFTSKRIATASSPSQLHPNAAPAQQKFLYPDRYRFEELRSRWEAAQVSNDDKQLKMVGRKEKPATQQPLNGDEGSNTSKFRRKLSQGLSLISLSQRRITPVRPLLPQDNLKSSVNVPYPPESTRLVSPTSELYSYDVSVRKATPEKTVSLQRNLDVEAPTEQLPRSHTMSFIPRPSQTVSNCSVIEFDSARTPQPRFTLEVETRGTPPKIPSPDYPASINRKTSPRQYHPSFTIRQAKHAAAVNSFARVGDPSPSKPSPVRSYTTPNLMQKARPCGSNNVRSPRKLNQRRQSSIPQKSNTKENSTPVTHRRIKRLSNIQEHLPQSSRREDLRAPTVTSKRRSTGPVSALASSKQRSCTTSPASSKRKSSQNVTQTPFAAQRALPKERFPVHSVGSLPESNERTSKQNCLLGPVSPSTSMKTEHAAARLSLPRRNTEKDLRKCAFPTPKKRLGSGMLARSHALGNNEVRAPQFSSYHHPVGVEDVPPVPPIPEQYKSASMPILVPTKVPLEKATASPEETSIQAQESQKTISHTSDTSIVALSHVPDSSHVQQTSIVEAARLSSKSLSTRKKSKLSIQIPASGRSFSTSLLLSAKSSGLWSTKTSQVFNIADVGVSPQVKDHMPVLYWAGRFQSRYDQWRTDAMQVELDPDYYMDGPLGHYNVHQEKLAACHIFLQLRAMCLSHQAADSLWEFEHKYRQDHNLLGTSYDLPPLNPKPEEEKQGSFGRAIRKMTPRKSSFVNLLKGKGWNAEELGMANNLTDSDLTITKALIHL